MNATIVPFHEIVKLNTRLFDNCFLDVDETTANKRINGKGNSMAFIALHALDARFYLANLLGEAVESPFKEALEKVNHIDDLKEYPKLESIRSAWTEISALLEKRIAGLTEEVLNEECAQPFPIDDKTLRGGIAFLLQHDSFHLGQLALLRRCFGLEGMRYT